MFARSRDPATNYEQTTFQTLNLKSIEMLHLLEFVLGIGPLC